MGLIDIDGRKFVSYEEAAEYLKARLEKAEKDNAEMQQMIKEATDAVLKYYPVNYTFVDLPQGIRVLAQVHDHSWHSISREGLPPAGTEHVVFLTENGRLISKKRWDQHDVVHYALMMWCVVEPPGGLCA